jgi:N-acetylmuramoyl-L-alanine amidase
MKSVLLLYPVLDLFVCSPLLKPGHIHIFEREFNSDILTRYVSLGKLDNCLGMLFTVQTISNGYFHILLDNGHAKSTPGKRMKLENGRFFYEYEFNRDVVKRIADSLDELHIPYEILVPELEKDISLTDRAARANSFCTKYGKDKCLFISVHSNACGDGLTFNKAKGWSIYTTKGETKSDEIATTFFNVADEELPKYGFTTRKDITDGDPDYEENFTVIYKTWCPAVLTENLFFTNKEEVKWLMSEEGRQVIADIHVKAIKKIVESK